MSESTFNQSLMWGDQVERVRHRLESDGVLVLCGRASMAPKELASQIARHWQGEVLWLSGHDHAPSDRLIEALTKNSPSLVVLTGVEHHSPEERAAWRTLSLSFVGCHWLVVSSTHLDFGPHVHTCQLLPVGVDAATRYFRAGLLAAQGQEVSEASLARLSQLASGEPWMMAHVLKMCELWGVEHVQGLTSLPLNDPVVSALWVAPQGVEDALAVAKLLGSPFRLDEFQGVPNVTDEDVGRLRRSCWIDPSWNGESLEFTLSFWVGEHVSLSEQQGVELLERALSHDAVLPQKSMVALIRYAVDHERMDEALKLGDRLFAQGFKAPWALLCHMVDYLHQQKRQQAHASWMVEHGKQAFQQGDYLAAISSVEMLDVELLPREVAVDLHHLRGWLARVNAKPQQALKEYEEVLSMAVLEKGTQGVIHTERAGALWEAGQTDAAIEEMEQALLLQQAREDRRGEGVVLSNLGVMKHNVGLHEEAWHHYHEALKIHREVGHRRFEGIALFDLSTLLYEQGALSLARSRCREAMTLLEEVSDLRQALLAKMVLGAINQAFGQDEEQDVELLEEDRILAKAKGLYQALGQLHCSLRFDSREAEKGLFADEVQFPARMIAKLRQALEQGRALTLTPDATMFSCGTSHGVVDLSRHVAQQSILLALVQAHLAKLPPLSIEGLVAQGWPDEQIAPDAAKNRVHVALSALRREGLKEAIVYKSKGYSLRQGMLVWFVLPEVLEERG